MGYETGMMDRRVTILARKESEEGRFGRGSGGTEWVEVATVWAAVDWSRGVKAMREGALDAYDVVMVRTRWRADLTRENRLKIDGKTYMIESLNADRRANKIQITAHEEQ